VPSEDVVTADRQVVFVAKSLQPFLHNVQQCSTKSTIKRPTMERS
jgi:hypothetical protein